MNPALSVLFFTTLSGAGLGLLILLSGWLVASPAALPRASALIVLLTGLVLLAFGLASSFMHLGQPWRAWRAFSQWRSSWLSREAVAAAATMVAGIVLAWLVAAGAPVASMRIAAIAVLGFASATLVTTAGIYDCLRTIRAWNNGYVLPTLVLAALLSGAGWLWLLLALGGWRLSLAAGAALAGASLLFGALKFAYWRFVDRIDYSGLGSAVTGLGAGGRVRPAEAPHTEANFLLREMGYVLARRHARRLRRLALGAIAGLPLLAMAIAQQVQGGEAILAFIGVIAQMTGLFIERWLFFAQARHVVTGYYR